MWFTLCGWIRLLHCFAAHLLRSQTHVFFLVPSCSMPPVSLLALASTDVVVTIECCMHAMHKLQHTGWGDYHDREDLHSNRMLRAKGTLCPFGVDTSWSVSIHNHYHYTMTVKAINFVFNKEGTSPDTGFHVQLYTQTKSLKNLNAVVSKITHIQNSVLVNGNSSGLDQLSQTMPSPAKGFHERTVGTK